MQLTQPARRATVLSLLSLLVGGILLALAPPGAAQVSPGGSIDVIRVEGVIDPVTAGYLEGRLERASEDGARVAIIQLDTPGGLDVSMRDIIKQMKELDLPVVVWVAPRGARAASAGTFITYAADLAYMAESTEIGAATPIDLGGGDLSQKVTNDAAAFIVALAEESGRNAEWAERAVREGASLPASDAAEIGVVDGIASSLREVLIDLDGRTVDAGGADVTLETWDEATGRPSATIRFQGMNLFARVLHAVTGPEIAYLLLLVGAFGIIFELYNPGIGLAGILGALALLLGFYGLSVLPTNWLGVLLIVASVIFFVVDLQIAGFGVWTVGGVVGLVLGGLVLFSGAADVLQVSPWAIVAAVAGSLVFFVSVMTAALRVRLRRPVTGEESIVGTVAVAKTDIAPEGMVSSKGMLWKARTMETGIAAGSKVEVKATEGLVLLVEPHHDDEQVPAP